MDSIDYDDLIQNALRDVVRRALRQARDHGLPGEHHFYITFQTNRADVQIPEHLRRDHPEEITVVVQHQFWDLEVGETEFSVTLSFNGKRERLVVPYAALVSFMDPFVKFGLQFSPTPVASPTPHEGAPKKDNVLTLDAFRNKKK